MPSAVATGGHAAETTIRPPSGLAALHFSDLWEYRELVYFLTKRELQVRYKQSVFGVAWAVMQPLALAFIFAIFFGVLANVPSDGLPYPLFALAGLVPWLFVSQTVAQASASLVGDSNLLSKVYFPRLVLPLARAFSLLLDLQIALVILVAMTLLYGQGLDARLLVLPGFLLLAVVTALGVGVMLAALNVQYRDVTVAVPLMVQIWLFITPVIYPGSLVEGTWRYVYALNPMVSVVDGVRWALLGAAAPPPGSVAISTAVAIVVAVAGVFYFRKSEHFFADLI